MLFFSIFNNKKLFELIIIVLLLFINKTTTTEHEEVQDGNVGLGEHHLEEGEVILIENSKIAKNEEDIEYYNKHFYEKDVCDIKLDENENTIIINYKNDDSVIDDGCTVDLLTKNKDFIKFSIGILSEDNCLTNSSNDNIIPFVYSLTYEHINDYDRGPIYSDKKCGKECKCIGKTGLEVGWLIDNNNKTSIIVRPIGESNSVKFHSGNNEEDMEDVEIKIKKGTIFSINEISSNKFQFDCLEKDKISIISPNTWSINGEKLDKKKKYLLVFHLLPLKGSSLLNMKNDNNCNFYLKFSGKEYALLTVENPNNNIKNNNNNVTSLNILLIIIIISFIVILILIIVILLIYFICIKNKKSKEEDIPYHLRKRLEENQLIEQYKIPKRKVKTKDGYEKITTKLVQPTQKTKTMTQLRTAKNKKNVSLKREEKDEIKPTQIGYSQEAIK